MNLYRYSKSWHRAKLRRRRRRRRPRNQRRACLSLRSRRRRSAAQAACHTSPHREMTTHTVASQPSRFPHEPGHYELGHLAFYMRFSQSLILSGRSGQYCGLSSYAPTLTIVFGKRIVFLFFCRVSDPSCVVFYLPRSSSYIYVHQFFP